MANNATGSLSSTALPDQVKARFTGNLNYVPGENEKWVYKEFTVPTEGTSATCFTTNDEFFGNAADSDTLSNDDIIRWISVKHSGTADGTIPTNEGVIIGHTGYNVKFKDIVKETSVTSTSATPAVINKASHGFSNGDYVTLSNFSGSTELNGITGIVENKADALFYLDGVYVDGSSGTSGIARTAGAVYSNTFLAPNDLYIAKLNHVTVADLSMGTVKLNASGIPTAGGASTVIVYIAAIVKDV